MNNKEIQDAFKQSAYQRWNRTTLTCLKHKMTCEDCPLDSTCNTIEPWYKNPYGIHNIKYATMMTYKNIGLKGLPEEVINELELNRQGIAEETS